MSLKVTEVITVSHLNPNRLQRLIMSEVKAGAKTIGETYLDNYGFHNQDLMVDLYPTIFLDFDGVLLAENGTNQEHAFNLWREGKLRSVKFDQNPCNHLIEVIENLGAKLKVHSRWRRRGVSEEDFRAILMNNGFKEEHFHSQLKCKYRAFSSDVWSDIGCSMDGVFAYVIIEDRDSGVEWRRKMQISPRAEIGLSKKDSLEVAKLLESKIEAALNSF